MTTDPIFYRLFETSPETLFLALGMPLEEARAMAARYQYLAIEFKETAHRSDGIFQPREPGLPAYFVEMQYYRLPSVYADILVKAYTYLKKNDPAQDFYAVVLFGSKSLEPRVLRPYQPLLDAGYLRRIYLDELPDVPDQPLGLSILRMIGQRPEPATESARVLLKRTKTEISALPLRSSLLQLIETVIIYKLPRLSREEIQAMIEVSDIRETRVFQEALAEGREEGLEKGLEKGAEQERMRFLNEKLAAIPKLAIRGLSADDIADILKIEITQVRQTLGQ